MNRENRFSCLAVLKMDVTEIGFENVNYIQMYEDTNHCLVVWYVFFWVIPRRLSSKRRRFGTLYRFHLQGRVDSSSTCP